MINGRRFEFRPGQFISLYLGSNGSRIARPYSIAAWHGENRFELCIGLPSPDAEADGWFRSAREGQPVEFAGPFGSLQLADSLPAVSVFIATGTGIAPLRAMLHELYRIHRPPEVWLIFGARRESDILYREEFERFARDNPSFHFIPTLSRPGDEWSGDRGRVQAQVRKYLANKHGLHAYLCGSPAMVGEVRDLFVEMGYPPEAISYERFE